VTDRAPRFLLVWLLSLAAGVRRLRAVGAEGRNARERRCAPELASLTNAERRQAGLPPFAVSHR
jgi:hypothetical protein